MPPPQTCQTSFVPCYGAPGFLLAQGKESNSESETWGKAYLKRPPRFIAHSLFDLGSCQQVILLANFYTQIAQKKVGQSEEGEIPKDAMFYDSLRIWRIVFRNIPVVSVITLGHYCYSQSFLFRCIKYNAQREQSYFFLLSIKTNICPT